MERAAGPLRDSLEPEILALRHQLRVLQRSAKRRPQLTAADRVLWAWLCGVWRDWRSALVIVKPETVIAWHRKGFRLFQTWKVRHGQPGRPKVLQEIRDLIRKMSRENPLWGAAPETAVTEVADLLGESPEEHGIDRLLHRADGPVPGPVRIPGVGPRPAADPPFQRDRSPDCGVDGTATPRGVSVGYRPSVALATGLRGTRDRHHSPRVPGPRDRLQ